MPEYIDREILQKEISEILHTAPLTYAGGLMLAADAVRTAPAADVREVKRGEWIIHNELIENVILDEKEIYQCSECGYRKVRKSCFCPNCGADMRPLYEKVSCKTCGGTRFVLDGDDVVCADCGEKWGERT